MQADISLYSQNEIDALYEEKNGKIGFEAFASKWKFKSLKVYRLKHERIKEYYNPEF